MSQFCIRSYPRCIVHVDGDGFFSSCEQAMHPELRGKPVVTGRERGIITSASKEARALGISRETRAWDAKKICPSLVFVESDYRSYELFSYRLVNVIRQFSSEVEHYSVDEAFADLTGLRRARRQTYEEIATEMKREIQASLGITVSLGISITKTLAKVASKWQKPDGLTFIPGRDIERYLRDLPAGKVWGIGPASAARLAKRGIRTALEFARLSPAVAGADFEKPLHATWAELRGGKIFDVMSGPSAPPKSLSRTRTFPPTADKKIMAKELAANIESAFWKLRKTGLGARRAALMAKTQQFRVRVWETDFERPTAFESDLLPRVAAALDTLVEPGVEYRSTGVFLTDLARMEPVQSTLFEAPDKLDRLRRLYEGMDKLRDRYRKPLVRVGPAKPAHTDRHLLDDLAPGVLLPAAPPRLGDTRIAFL